MEWTDEKVVADLRVRIARGESRTEIARVHGVSRNAIVGAIWRAGIDSRGREMGAMVVNARRRKNAERKRPFEFGALAKKRAPPQRHTVIRAAEPAPLRVSYLDLNAGHCRWLCEETGDHCLPLSCGHPTVNDSSWCQHHYGRAFA